jgi:hypothetical protein
MTKLSIPLVTAALCLATPLHAREFIVDQADSLDFQGFHKTVDQKDAAQRSTGATPPARAASDLLVVSERYNPTPSRIGARNSAFSVINDLHRRMAEQCPAGFEIHRQWSLPLQQDWLMHYGYTCLQQPAS